MSRATRFAAAALALTLGACDTSPQSDAPLPTPTLAAAIAVVPGATLPAEYTAVSGMSNNNLDVVRHSDGAIYLALRTSRDHFASDASRMLVLRSVDQQTWTFEAMFSTGTDVREPRLLSHKGRLFLYYAKLGTDPGKFEPQGMFVTERKAERDWTTPTTFYAPTDNFIPWRSKVRNGRAWMTAYRGGEHIYDLSGLPIDVQLLVSDDGLAWQPVDPSRPNVLSGGGSETDFDFDERGDLYAVNRNEAGDETGYGSKICRAKASDLSAWTCAHDSKKYDSPLVFRVDDEVYLVGRRNLTETGNYDLERRDLTVPGQELTYQLDYRGKPKRCSLWRWVKGEDRIAYVLDLPSKGDTCFASVLEGDKPNERIIYNYSSDLDLPGEPTWGQGQIGPTHIYRDVLVFAPR